MSDLRYFEFNPKNKKGAVMRQPHVKDRVSSVCFSVSIKQRQHWDSWDSWETAFQCKFTHRQLTDIKINIRNACWQEEEQRQQLLHVVRNTKKKKKEEEEGK